VVEPHEAPDGLAIWHFDFYRFDDPREWKTPASRPVCRARPEAGRMARARRPLLPTADLTLRLDVDADERRRVHLVAGTRVGEQLLQELRA
jgi:tRNA threonylcarbamoyladenosine biosynthesis protein TsaE